MSAPRLDPQSVLIDMIAVTWQQRRMAWDMLTIPLVLSLALRMVFQLGFEARGVGLGSLLAHLVDTVPTTMFLVAWQRYLLLGPAAVGWIPGFAWSRRETRYWLHLMSLVLVPVLLIAMPMLGGEPDVAMVLTVGVPMLVTMAFGLRLAFGLPATAVDIAWVPALSWRYGKGNGVAIVGVLLLPALAGAFVMFVALLITLAVLRALLGEAGEGLSFGRSLTLGLLLTVLSYVQTAVIGTALVSMFRSLTGFRPGAPLQPPP